jgi:hypothetical protein
MNKYGFVYLWFDKKRKMYYIGCHWGVETDGYICSSNRMRKAYKRRPADFKRKILSSNISNRELMFEEEHRWMSLIEEKDLGKKYYNLRKHKWGHWTTDENTKLSISEKISQKTKEAMYRPEVREKYLAGLSTRDNRSSELEVREKRRQSMIGKNVGKDNSKALAMAAAANRGRKLTKEHKNKIKETTAFKTLNSMKIKCTYCNFVGNKGNVARYHNEKCKQKILCV